MPQTMPQSDALTRLNAVQATAKGPLTHVHSGHDILGIVQRVHHELRVKQQYAAGRAGVKESQYSAALHGSGNFSIVWLFGQEPAFLLRWFELAMEHYGLDATNKRAVRANRILELMRLLTEDGQ